MTARIKPLIIYIVERSGGSLTLHAVPVEKESDLFYYLPSYAQPWFRFKARIPKAKAHRSQKAAWTAQRDDLLGSINYYKAGIATLEALLKQIPTKMAARHPRKVAA